MTGSIRARTIVRASVAVLLAVGAAMLGKLASEPAATNQQPLSARPGAKPLNVIFVLVHDLRFDAVGFRSWSTLRR